MNGGMKRNLAAVLLLASSTSVAVAQDSARWTGFYAGGQVGFGFGVPNTEFLSVDGVPGTEIEKIYDITPNRGPAGPQNCNVGSTAGCTYARDGEFAGKVDTDPTGMTGGLHFGYNQQMSNFVIGVEADYDWTGIEGTGSVVVPPKTGTLLAGQTLDTTPASMRVWSKFDNLTSIRGRIGMTTGPLMIYGTGGVAFTKYKGSATSPEGVEADPRDGDPENESGTYKWSDDKIGWVIGGGLEVQVSSNLTVRVEGMHYDFGSVKFGHDGDLEDFDEEAGNIEGILGKHDLSVNQVRIGASYHFN